MKTNPLIRQSPLFFRALTFAIVGLLIVSCRSQSNPESQNAAESPPVLTQTQISSDPFEASPLRGEPAGSPEGVQITAVEVTPLPVATGSVEASSEEFVGPVLPSAPATSKNPESLEAEASRAVFNSDCFTNKHCSVVIIQVPPGHWQTEIKSNDVDYVRKVLFDRWVASLKATFPYKAIDFLFAIDGLGKSVDNIFSIIEAKTALELASQESFHQGTGGQYLIAHGEDVQALLNQTLRQELVKSGLTVLGWIPTSKLLGSAFRGVKMSVAATRFDRMVKQGRLSYDQRKELADYLFRNNEFEAAYRALKLNFGDADVQAIRKVFYNASYSNLRVVAKWAAWTTALRLSGLSIPDRPKDLSSAELVKFAYRQGTAFVTGNYGNPTTRAIRLAGEDAWNYISNVVAEIKSTFGGTNKTTEEVLMERMQGCDSCPVPGVPAEVLARMSTTDLQRHLEVLVDEEGVAMVRFNPEPD